jgi:mannitol/fructose-specific phosphotransferase system IIA component (Ntr-type)
MFRKLLKRELTFPKVKVKNRDELFEEFAERAEKLDLVTSSDEFLKALREREEQGSTEIAPGIAMPHAKSDLVKKPFIMVATSKKGIKYHGFSKVNLVFCLAAPKDDPVYLTLMAKSARLLKKKEFVDEISRSDVPEDVLNAIFSYEERSEATPEKGRENMHLIFLVLNDEEEMDMVLSLFLETGIKNPTILDSSYLIEKIQTEIPLFSVFAMGKRKNFASKTVFGVSDDPLSGSRLNSLLKQEGIDLWEPGKGMLFSLPLASVFGGVDPEVEF